MDDLEGIDLYIGTKMVSQFSINLHNGAATLTCDIGERWEEILARTIKCGGQFTRTLKSRRGISISEKTNLAAAVTGSLGLKGIAELQSKMSGEFGRTVNLEESLEVEDAYHFEAPKCGRRVIKLYQQQRHLFLRFEDRRVFRNTPWSDVFIEWLDRIHDGSRVVDNDPDCRCGTVENERKSDGRFLVTVGNTTLVARFEARNGQIYLPDLRARLPTSFSWKNRFTVNLERRMLPDYLLFLMRDEATSFRAEFALLDASEQAVGLFEQMVESDYVAAPVEATVNVLKEET
jgi:hypothetical protein